MFVSTAESRFGDDEDVQRAGCGDSRLQHDQPENNEGEWTLVSWGEDRLDNLGST